MDRFPDPPMLWQPWIDAVRAGFAEKSEETGNQVLDRVVNQLSEQYGWDNGRRETEAVQFHAYLEAVCGLTAERMLSKGTTH